MRLTLSLFSSVWMRIDQTFLSLLLFSDAIASSQREQFLARWQMHFDRVLGFCFFSLWAKEISWIITFDNCCNSISIQFKHQCNSHISWTIFLQVLASYLFTAQQHCTNTSIHHLMTGQVCHIQLKHERTIVNPKSKGFRCCSVLRSGLAMRWLSVLLFVAPWIVCVTLLVHLASWFCRMDGCD